MTLSTTGYGLFGGPQIWSDYQSEVTLLTASNQIVLEHRYYEGSRPAHDEPEDLDRLVSDLGNAPGTGCHTSRFLRSLARSEP